MDPVEDESRSSPEIYEQPTLFDAYASSSSSSVNLEHLYGASKTLNCPDYDAESNVSDDMQSSILQDKIETLLEELGNDKIQYGPKVSLSQTDFKSLMSRHRMTGSIVDAYLTLISNRGKEKGFRPVYCFDSAFGIDLLEQGPTEANLHKSCHNLDLYSYNFLLVPFWCISYWMMFLVDNVQRKIMFYDIGKTSDLAIDRLQNFLKLYHTTYVGNRIRRGSNKIDSPFKSYLIEIGVADRLNIPAAVSFSDTDVLVLVFAELISKSPVTTRNYKIINCEYYRRKITYELLTKKLLSEDTVKYGEPELVVEAPQPEKCQKVVEEPSTSKDDNKEKTPADIPEFCPRDIHLQRLLSEKLTLLDLLCDRTGQFWIPKPPEE